MGLLSLPLLVLVLAGQPDRYPGWDKLYVKPQLPLTAIQSSGGDVTMLLYHSYPAALHNLRLAVRSDVLELVGPAPAIAEMEPTLIRSLKLPVRVKAATKDDTCTLHVLFTADEIAKEEDYTVIVPLTKHGEQGANQSYSMPVGQISVILAPRGNLVYAFECVLLVVVLGWFFWRKRRVI